MCVPGTFSTGCSFLCAYGSYIWFASSFVQKRRQIITLLKTFLLRSVVCGFFTVAQHCYFLLLEIEREYKSISFQYCYDQHSMQKKKKEGRSINHLFIFIILC